MENQNSNLGLNLPTPPPNGASPLSQFSPYLPPVKPTTVEEPGLWESCGEFLNSKKFTETTIWLVLLVLFVPSGMAVASWNAVPGDFTYSWKTGLEKSLLLVLKPSKTLQTSTQVALTQRRYAEAAKLLRGDQAQLGLRNLSEQVETTSDSIRSLSDGSSKTAFTMQYIEALTELNEKLEAEKQQQQAGNYRPSSTASRKPGAAQPNGSSANTGSNQGSTQGGGGVIIQNTYVQNTIIQTVTAAPGAATSVTTGTTAPTSILPPAPIDEVTNEITQTQEQIQNTIAELQNQVHDQPVIQPTRIPDPDPTAIPQPEAEAPKASGNSDSIAPQSLDSQQNHSQQTESKKSDEEKDPKKDSSKDSEPENSNSGSGSRD